MLLEQLQIIVLYNTYDSIEIAPQRRPYRRRRSEANSTSQCTSSPMEPCGPPPPYSYEPLATRGSFHGSPAYSPPEHLPLPSIMSVGFDGLSVSPSHRFPLNRDDLDGPVQFLNKPDGAEFEPQDEDIPNLPTNLLAPDQYFLLSQMNDRLSRSVFDFIAKYQFPIPIEATKRPVCVPSDRQWSEWVGLLKRHPSEVNLQSPTPSGHSHTRE